MALNNQSLMVMLVAVHGFAGSPQGAKLVAVHDFAGGPRGIRQTMHWCMLLCCHDIIALHSRSTMMMPVAVHGFAGSPLPPGSLVHDASMYVVATPR